MTSFPLASVIWTVMLPVPEMAASWAFCSGVSVILSEPEGTVMVMVDASLEAAAWFQAVTSESALFAV